MARVVEQPPVNAARFGNWQENGHWPAGWWHEEPDSGRIICDLCPRECALKPGDRGFCFVRQNLDGQMVLTTYGRSTGFCIDPIEKKPLNHFYPGTSVLSFGTAGCNLGCKFCQNWDISKSREVERLSELAGPEAIAHAAQAHGCRSVAYTYNDPVIWAEYAIDTAKACRASGIKNVAVTAGYIHPKARAAFFEFMDAANVDLKGFTEDFYYHITYAHLQPILETLEWLKRETNVWFEITNLIIPQTNDQLDDLQRMSDWILQHVGDEVPVHFTAFHPDFRMRELPPTPPETLVAAREIAMRTGLKYAYVGNVHDVARQSTYCPDCKAMVIERDWYALGIYQLHDNRCARCGQQIAGHFDAQPGDWGQKRLPVRIAEYARPAKLIQLDPPVSTPPSPQVTVTSPSKGTPMSVPSTSSPQGTPPQRPQLTDPQQRSIQHAANEWIAAPICDRPVRIPDPTLAGAADIPVMGAFVTLKRRGQLRACCGTLGQPMRLSDALAQSARRTALEDARLPPISSTELRYLDLDVSLLYGFEPLRVRGRDRIAAVEVGRHGLQVRREQSAGLLLPMVAVEHGMDAETFLRQVCRKAGLPSNAWEDDGTQVVTFESFAFGGPFDVGVLDAASERRFPMFSDAEMQSLLEHCRSNVLAISSGATPNYYLFGVPDGTVAGATLSAKLPTSPDWMHVAQLSIRPGIPLQTTLFQLSEALANLLRRQRFDNGQLSSMEMNVALLYDSAMHGTVNEPDLRGVQPCDRAVLTMERGQSAWVFDPTKTAEQLLEIAKQDCRIRDGDHATVLSFAAQAHQTPIRVSTAPRAVLGAELRPAAVAGSFYPAESNELRTLVRELLDGPVVKTESWPAVMVPHAGLRYSGRLAAQVLRQVQIPQTVIVVGPKHTRAGVEWAVAPHAAWQIPGSTIPSDPQLAEKLVAAIPGLELDAAAHQDEHAIEVELPIFAELAPKSHIVGIAIGGGNFARCREFATGLASVIRQLPQAPLLVISSDMNHFATDAENRRLDAIALQAMESCDAGQLLEVVSQHGISMCGVLPAVIVMETLKALGGMTRCQRVGYATSADASGDTRRVVGYAGMLLR